MPPLNNIQGGRWDTFLRRLLPIKEQSIAPVLAPELVGMVVTQEWEPEQYLLREEKLYHAAVAVSAPGAGQNNFINILNPNNSGNLVILEGAFISSATAGVQFQLRMELRNGTEFGIAGRDTRLGMTINAATAVPSEGDAAGIAGVLAQIQQALATTVVQFNMPIVLAPNSGVTMWADANVQISGGYLWRERAAESAELALSVL